jgi:HTH-type transcriptional regulator/antitoxin HipB
MLIRTPADLGAIIRDRRKTLGLDQAELASRVEVSRQWIISVEQGKSRAELGLVLRTLDVLGVRLETRLKEAVKSLRKRPDIDAIVSSARKGER